jgi:hypothetical protein
MYRKCEDILQPSGTSRKQINDESFQRKDMKTIFPSSLDRPAAAAEQWTSRAVKHQMK